MKSIHSIFAVAFLLVFFTSCTDDEVIKVQEYKDDEMISIIQTMSVDIDSLEMKGDVERDFAKLMMIHHQGAIDMGMKQIAKGDDSELKIMAKTMIDRQQSEMDKMTLFLMEHDLDVSPEGHQWDEKAEASMIRMDNNVLLQSKTGAADIDFSALLIHHHHAANEMAQAFLQHSNNSDLNEMVSKMIQDKNVRIEQLQNWLLQNRSQ